MKQIAPLILLILCVVWCLPLSAQDDVPENFGRTLLFFDVSVEDEDFGFPRTLGAAYDLSKYYVAGSDGFVYVYDEKGRFEETIETGETTPVNDLAVDRQGNLYVAHGGSIFIYDADNTFIREIAGSLGTQYYSRIVPLNDGTFYATEFFGGDSLYHLNIDGSIASPTRVDFFSNLSDETVGIFDQFTVGQDGLFYYYNQDSEIFFQFDEDGELINRYTDLIDTFSLRGAILIDKDRQVLIGGSSVVEIYGAKESLVNTLALEENGFVSDMAFVSDGQLVVLQRQNISVLQYGERDR